jgi:uncharacterized membrane protein YeaQ/YmgE (transglycosylase-associated protein family)
MQIIVLLVAMILVGLLVGAVASLIWKENKPLGAAGDYVVAVISSIIIGLIDWYVIPAMGFSNTIKYLGVATEPVLVLWMVRKAKK